MSLKNNWVNASPMSKLILLGILMTFCTLVSLGLFYAVNEIVWGYSIQQISFLNSNTDPEIVWAAKFLQIFSQIGLFIAPAFLFAYLVSSSPGKELKVTRAPNISSIGIILTVTLLSIPFINFLAIGNSEIHLPEFMKSIEDWMMNMQRKNDILMEVILQMNSSRDVVINIVMMTLLPALGEELIFRGIIQKQLIKWLRNPHVAIFITALFFSAFHMQIVGFLSRLLLGMLFGYFYYYSKNIWTAIWGHFINNGLALGLAIIYGSQADSTPIDSEPTTMILIASTVAFLVALSILITQRTKLQNGFT